MNGTLPGAGAPWDTQRGRRRGRRELGGTHVNRVYLAIGRRHVDVTHCDPHFGDS
jgi:hypothetical protein